MKIFVISLERALDRRTYIQNHLNELKVDYEIINAVDYQIIEDEEFINLVDQASMQQNKYLTKSVASCGLSHIKVYDRIVKDKLPMALVVEDDVHLPKNIAEILASVEKNILHDEVIALSYYSHFSNTVYLSKQKALSMANGNQLLYPVDISYMASGMAYVITKSVAKKLSERLKPISIQADYWGVFYERECFSSFRCLYPIQVKPALFRTTLNYALSASWKSKLASFVRKNNIPIVSGVLKKRSVRMIEQKHISVLIDKPPFIENEKCG